MTRKTTVRRHRRQLKDKVAIVRQHQRTLPGKEQPLRFIPAPPFKAVNRLPVQVSIIVPSTKHDKMITPAEFEKRIENEKRWFSKRFGGDTSVRVVGSYFDGEKLITEPAVVVQSSMSVSTYKKIRRTLASHAMARKKQWKQDTVLLGVEGHNFIVPKRNYIDDDKEQPKFIPVT